MRGAVVAVGVPDSRILPSPSTQILSASWAAAAAVSYGTRGAGRLPEEQYSILPTQDRPAPVAVVASTVERQC
jgi:hypothetical protein